MWGVRPQVYAHRGGAGLAPENTIAAFDNGLALGADGLELDVQLSRDGVPVVIHDPTLDRTTDADGPVSDRTAEELASLDAGYRYVRDGLFPFRGRGFGVPALRDVLARYPSTPLIVELKGSDARLAQAVVDDLHAAGVPGHVTVGSFSQGALDAVRAYDPSIRTGADMDEIRNELEADVFGKRRSRLLFHSYQVPEVYAGVRVVSPEFVARSHAAGATVIVWIVNLEADIRRLLDWGVDGVITDRPDVAVPTVRAWWEERVP